MIEDVIIMWTQKRIIQLNLAYQTSSQG